MDIFILTLIIAALVVILRVERENERLKKIEQEHKSCFYEHCSDMTHLRRELEEEIRELELRLAKFTSSNLYIK